ncbi:hypothetical protein EDB85DRAFT_2151377 [Lactarius pseudohatsudake]|nr:hypothetical protein EDB85DRAFT_2151377 [Lactarius pseudohatsudake]
MLSEKSALLEPLVDVFSKAGRPDTAHQSPESASQATQLSALDGIAETLTDPPIFDFDLLVRSTWSSLRKRSLTPPEIPKRRAG